MYKLIQNKKDEFGVSDVYYETPCGKSVHIAVVQIGDTPDETFVRFVQPIVT